MTNTRSPSPVNFLLVGIAGGSLALGSLAACSKEKPAPTTPQVAAEPAKSPAPTPEPAGDPEPAASPQRDLYSTIYFEFDSSELSQQARDALSNNAEWLSEDAARSLTIEGHTDEVGTTEYNVALGDRRARAARDYLLALGIASERVRVVSYGEERPAAPGVDDKNRRSVFISGR